MSGIGEDCETDRQTDRVEKWTRLHTNNKYFNQTDNKKEIVIIVALSWKSADVYNAIEWRKMNYTVQSGGYGWLW